jgi:hypothetical protein
MQFAVLGDIGINAVPVVLVLEFLDESFDDGFGVTGGHGGLLIYVMAEMGVNVVSSSHLRKRS